MISFSPEATLSDIEGRYAEIISASGQSLQLPTQFSDRAGIGVLPAISQFIATWVRAQPEGRLFPPPNANSFDELVRQPHGLIAVYMAPHLTDGSGHQLNRNEALRKARSVVDAMQSGRLQETTSDSSVFLASFAGARNEFLLPLYALPTTDGGLRGTSDFEQLTRDIVNACGSQLLQLAEERDLKAISSLLIELFENTNDHATKDVGGRRYDWTYPNVRAIGAKHISIASVEDAKVALKGDPLHQLYFGKALLKKPTLDKSTRKETAQTDFLEIAVTDGGPGIASRWLADKEPNRILEDTSIDEELAMVRSAFEFGASSKVEGGTGIGLDAALRSLGRLRALFRLRTGRLCLYQDFGNSDAGFSPSRWTLGGEQLSLATGTAYSILIPISLQVKK